MSAAVGATACSATKDGGKGCGDVTSTPPRQRSSTDQAMLPRRVDEMREKGNAALRGGDGPRAIHLYTIAIEMARRAHPEVLASEDAAEDVRAAAPQSLFQLNRVSGGELAKLLSNRSHAHLKAGDHAEATADAEACVAADPTLEKGHMRLLLALEASPKPCLARQLEACERGLRACPDGPLLNSRKGRLLRAAESEEGGITSFKKAAASAASQAEVSAIEATRAVANDRTDPRHAMASGDLGSALAVGAFGLAKDVAEAERYLRMGAGGGDVSSRRNLGLLLLEQGRLAEAMEQLGAAAQAGDTQAAATLQQLSAESAARETQARAQLQAMAARGDERAIAMLRELMLREAAADEPGSA